jgi:3-oxoadipate enol-lactonase
MPRVRSGAIEIHCHVEGAGPWLTLLHGFSQDLHVWDAQVERLAGRFRLLRIDLRGHGGSSAPANGYGPVEHAADLLAVLDALSIAATHLWGTHTGAAIGLLLAIEHPDRVGSLVLEGPVIPGVATPAVDEWQSRASSVARRDSVAAARSLWFDQAPFFAAIRHDPERRRAAAHRGIIDRFSGAPWLATEPALPVPDVRNRLSSIRHRTLIVNGAADLPEFLATAELLERELSSSRRYLVPAAGAFPAWEAPDAVTPLVAQFLDDDDM